MTGESFTGVRVLDDGDLRAVREILQRDPVERVFVAARVDAFGLDPLRLGCPIWGYFRDGTLVSLCHAGANLVAIDADADALRAFAGYAGPLRRCSSIVGDSATTLSLWEGLSDHWGVEYARVREIRSHQPMLAMTDDPVCPSDPRVVRVGLDMLEPYFDAAVRMYTEEVGVSPLLSGNRSGYHTYVRRLILAGRAFGIIENGRVIYKSDLGSVSQGVAQVQGVWLAPDLRGRGLSVPAMASVVRLTRQREAPTVSLYVNDFNRAARATYERVGFQQVGDFATVLY